MRLPIERIGTMGEWNMPFSQLSNALSLLTLAANTTRAAMISPYATFTLDFSSSLPFSRNPYKNFFPYAAFLTFDGLEGLVLGSIDNFSPIECSKVKMLLISGLPFLDSIR